MDPEVEILSDHTMKRGRLALALVHYPVSNKNREVIGSAVTNLDIHDIARTGRTYGIDSYYIVTPYEDQRQMVDEILEHWRTGHGATYNARRKEALKIVSLCQDLDSLYAELAGQWGVKPRVIATCASPSANCWSYETTRQRLADGEDLLILFGTGWGLTAEVLAGVDAVLPPIEGAGDYNHLPVRAAAAIILDRLLGRREC